MMQDKIKHIDSLYLTQLQALNNWYDQALNTAYREHSQPPPTYSSPPQPIIPFGWKEKTEDRLVKLGDELLYLKFFNKSHPAYYKEVFRPHFIPDVNTIINPTKCERRLIDLVWVFSRLLHFSVISSKHDLRIFLPRHFFITPGEIIKATVINTYLTRIRKGIYQPNKDLEWQINSIF